MTCIVKPQLSCFRILTGFLIAFISVLAALMVTMVAIGIEHPGKGVAATKATDFVTAFGAVTNIIFAYGERSLQDMCYST